MSITFARAVLTIITIAVIVSLYLALPSVVDVQNLIAGR